MALPAGRYGVTKNQLLKIKKLPMNTIKLLEELFESKCDNTVIAPVENGSIASQAYAVGEHFIRDGAFCTCKQAISQGGSFTLGTNYTAGDVATQFGLYIPIANNAGFHNSIFRGKNLGSTVTAAQRSAITAGTFDDMYIGDYWEINSIKWRIAHFDYWIDTGDDNHICNTHHIVIVPDSALITAKMNDTDTSAGAYFNSKMRTENIDAAKTIVYDAFGQANILSYRDLLANTVTNGYESVGTWYDCDIEIMSEMMVLGTNVFHNILHGTNLPFNNTINKTQFALFKFAPQYIPSINVAQTGKSFTWLRDVVNSTSFSFIAKQGNTSYNQASNTNSVRPCFAIK